jgi:hypothetical protein
VYSFSCAVKTHLYIVAADGMEGRNRLWGKKKAEFPLSINMLKIIFLFLKAPKLLPPKVPAFFKR